MMILMRSGRRAASEERSCAPVYGCAWKRLSKLLRAARLLDASLCANGGDDDGEVAMFTCL